MVSEQNLTKELLQFQKTLIIRLGRENNKEKINFCFLLCTVMLLTILPNPWSQSALLTDNVSAA